MIIMKKMIMAVLSFTLIVMFASFSCFAVTVVGDVNIDGTRSSEDLIYLKKILLGTIEETSTSDINNDRTVDILDLIRLKKIFVNNENLTWYDGTEQGVDDIFPVE